MVFGILLATGASLTASVLVFQVAVLPLMFRYSKTVKRKVVFSNCINYPRNLDYDSPSSCSVIGGRNFNIEFNSIVDDCNIKLGIWHILPQCDIQSVCDKSRTKETVLQALKNTRNPIILYCHGNSNHRASQHRLKIYSLFQELNFHVITFDYRGYGDSTRVKPTERGVVEDLLYVYSWLLENLDYELSPTVVLWGHSLGTAVAANFVSNLQDLCKERGCKQLRVPDALVLEAPFNNLKDEIAKHPLSKLVSWLPYFKGMFVKPFADSTEYSFTTDEYLSLVPDLPILILHSKCDRVVPYELAVKLQNRLVNSRKSSNAPVSFHTFEKENGVGHNNLCEADNFKLAISEFLQLLEQRKK